MTKKAWNTPEYNADAAGHVQRIVILVSHASVLHYLADSLSLEHRKCLER